MVSHSQVQVAWHGDRAKWSTRAALADGLTEAAQMVQTESLAVVPRASDVLADSAKVSPAQEADLVAAVSYDTPYAVKQHEALGFHHPRGETAKYLERPLIANRAAVGRIIAAAMRRKGL